MCANPLILKCAPFKLSWKLQKKKSLTPSKRLNNRFSPKIRLPPLKTEPNVLTRLRPFARIIATFPLVLTIGSCVNEAPPQPATVVVTQLVQLLRDPSPDIRRTAALSLGKIADSNSIPALVAALHDPDSQVRAYSAWALGQIGSDVTHEGMVALVGALGDGDPAVKDAAALALWFVDADQTIVDLLNQAFVVSEPATRMAILKALMGISHPSAYDVFVDALDDPDSRVRQAAVAGLGELGDRRAIRYFRKIMLQDPDESVRAEAAYRLGMIGTRAEIPALKKVQETDPAPLVQLWASWALHRIEAPST
ncbi:MAG: HEAT repeat domain-containing protein [Nitrospirae bacterium]|nr:MAG: HEAT repeat domain-containing protein [Nitrospirota bacterium]